MGVSYGSSCVVIHLEADDTAIYRSVHLRLHLFSVQKFLQRITARVRNVQRRFAKNSIISLTFVRCFKEDQHQESADPDENAQSGIYEIQAGTCGHHDCRYYKVLHCMDLFEFDFHMIVKVYRKDKHSMRRKVPA